MATHICTHCGYEGKPVRPPSDETPENGDRGRAFDKVAGGVANLVFPGLGLIIRPLAMLMVLPIYIILWPIKRKMNPPKHCSNCGLPLMVKLTSDAGWIAKRKQEIKSGAVKIEHTPQQKKTVAFGKEVLLPSDEIDKAPEPERLTQLPSLNTLLADKEEPPAPVAEVKAEPIVRKKPVDPDQW